MDPVIRPARDADAPALADLSAQLGYPVAPEALRATLARLGADPAHCILVADVDGRPVGWLHARESWSLELGGRAEIAGLVVDAAHRGRGLGAHLVASAEAWARERGHAQLRVRSRVEREAARRFYRRLGFAETKVQAVLDKPLAPAGGAPRR